VARKVANKLRAVRDKVKKAAADKGSRVANKVAAKKAAANKVGKRADSRTAN
jgi:hypothetical protein